MRTLLLLSFLALVSCTTNTTVVAPITTQVDDRVVIVNNNCSGLLMGDKVVTCYHCAKPLVSIIYANGMVGVGRLINALPERDLALYKVTNAPAGHGFGFDFDPHPMTPIYTIGHPVAGNYQISHGEISVANIQKDGRHLTLCRMRCTFGNSGGPVFSHENKLVGIVTSVYPSTPYTYIIPSQYVIELLKMP